MAGISKADGCAFIDLNNSQQSNRVGTSDTGVTRAASLMPRADISRERSRVQRMRKITTRGERCRPSVADDVRCASRMRNDHGYA